MDIALVLTLIIAFVAWGLAAFVFIGPFIAVYKLVKAKEYTGAVIFTLIGVSLWLGASSGVIHF